MRWRGGSSRSVDDEVVGADEWETEWAGASTGAVANSTVLVRCVVWSLVLAGPVLGLLALTHPEGSAAAASPVRKVERSRAPEGTEAAGPAGFAEMFVAAYLRAGEGEAQSLAVFYPGVSGLRLSGEAAVVVGSSATVRVDRVREGYWSVTVAVRVRAAEGDDGGQSPRLRYFRVSVARPAPGQGRLVATSLPAAVSVPSAAGDVSLGYGRAVPPRKGDPVADALKGFFGAYLTGDGQLGRYLSPETSLEAVSPAPYTKVRILRFAVRGSDDADHGVEAQQPPTDGARREVLVDVEAAAKPSGAWRPMTYAVSLTARDGRWEITEVGAAPALAEPAASPTEHGGRS